MAYNGPPPPGSRRPPASPAPPRPVRPVNLDAPRPGAAVAATVSVIPWLATLLYLLSL